MNLTKIDIALFAACMAMYVVSIILSAVQGDVWRVLGILATAIWCAMYYATKSDRNDVAKQRDILMGIFDKAPMGKSTLSVEVTKEEGE